jgi:hypothetical protein
MLRFSGCFVGESRSRAGRAMYGRTAGRRVLVGRQLYGAAADQVVIALRIGGSRRRDDMEEAKVRPASPGMF